MQDDIENIYKTTFTDRKSETEIDVDSAWEHISSNANSNKKGSMFKKFAVISLSAVVLSAVASIFYFTSHSGQSTKINSAGTILDTAKKQPIKLDIQQADTNTAFTSMQDTPIPENNKQDFSPIELEKQINKNKASNLISQKKLEENIVEENDTLSIPINPKELIATEHIIDSIKKTSSIQNDTIVQQTQKNKEATSIQKKEIKVVKKKYVVKDTVYKVKRRKR